MNTASTTNLLDFGFETASLKLVPHWKVTFAAPTEAIDRKFENIIKKVELRLGKTDQNAILHAAAHEYYPPLQGTPTGAVEQTLKATRRQSNACCHSSE